MDNAWLDTMEGQLADSPPDGDVYCRRCVYFGQHSLKQDLAQALVGRYPRDPRFMCWHPNARVVCKDWDGVHHGRVPPWERNAQNDCADFAPRTLRNYYRIYPYRTWAVVLGLTGFVMWVLGW
jgi:hypothetical protein